MWQITGISNRAASRTQSATARRYAASVAPRTKAATAKRVGAQAHGVLRRGDLLAGRVVGPGQSSSA